MSLDFQSYLKQSIKDASEKRQSFYVSTDAKERPKLKLTAREVVKEKQKEQREEPASVPVLEGLRDLYTKHKHILLIGRPGSGKSTALNQLLIDEATRAIDDSSLPIPVLVQLRSDKPILELIQKTLRRGRLRCSESEVNDLLFDGKLLLLLDGVNEIPRQDLRQELQNFREDNPDVLMVFTTRDLAVGGYLGIEKQLEMQPLTPAQLREFVRQYFPERTEEFLNQLSDRLKKLGETPLLLEMLCGVFQRTGRIPENLGLVFREFTQHYERNLKEGVRVESDKDWWKPVLQQLAWVMMQGEKPTEFRVAIGFEEAVRAIAQFLEGRVPYAEDFARKCVRDLQKYHLIQAGANREELEFRHQLIQEYYGAETLLEQLTKLGDEQLKCEFLNYLKWTEPVALMLPMIKTEAQALRLVKLALEVDLILGARLAGGVPNRLQDQAVELISSLDVQFIGDARRFGEGEKQMIRIVDRRTLVQNLRDEFFEKFPEVERLIDLGVIINLPCFSDALKVRLLSASGSEAAVPRLVEALEEALKCDNPDIRDAAVIGLVKNPSTQVTPALVELFLQQENFRKDLIRILIDSDTENLSHILESIAKSCSPQFLPEILSIVTNRLHLQRVKSSIEADESLSEEIEALHFNSNEVRAWLYQLSEAGKQGDEGSIRILLSTVRDVETPDELRSDALDALLRIKNYPEIASVAFEILEDDICECLTGVRAAAIDGIGKLGDCTMLTPLFKYMFYTLGNLEVGWDGEWDKILRTIVSIQRRCQFYNYEIYQAHLEAQKHDRQTPQNSDRSATINNFPNATEVKIFENVDLYHEAPLRDPSS
ncbi:NACHT domain-containing protein [Leptolyngbya sp. NIES-2104]|uniref:NACHT domain-containing protein n=1 Tax=Leptolyngbya sp. NIES-2104 TaxID=1552121 RepID=UPI000AA62FC4|nr:NACHT domain-containing protein [Leptolyngbya sp. NIES-2104]